MGSIVSLLILSAPAYAARLLADEILDARRIERRRQESNRRAIDLQLRAMATEQTRMKRIIRR